MDMCIRTNKDHSEIILEGDGFIKYSTDVNNKCKYNDIIKDKLDLLVNIYNKPVLEEYKNVKVLSKF